MGLFTDNYNASSSIYAPPASLDESAVASEGIPLNILTALGGSNATITRGLSENRVAAMSVLFCLLVFLVISHARSPMRKLPPQPRRNPVVGNLSQMRDKKWLFSRELKEQFGEYEDLAG